MGASAPFFLLRPKGLATPWPATHTIRRAGVTALGMGGSNAHVIVEQPPAEPATRPDPGRHTLVLSGRTPEAVRAEGIRP